MPFGSAFFAAYYCVTVLCSTTAAENPKNLKKLNPGKSLGPRRPAQDQSGDRALVLFGPRARKSITVIVYYCMTVLLHYCIVFFRTVPPFPVTRQVTYRTECPRFV